MPKTYFVALGMSDVWEVAASDIEQWACNVLFLA